MDQKNNVVGWFEIPVQNMDRAVNFYQTVFSVKLARHTLGTLEMAWFPWRENVMGAAGSLVYHPDYYKPSPLGVLIYFTTPTGDLIGDLQRVEKAGGKVLQRKKPIGEDHGFMGLFLDTEGNRIAIHSMK